MCVLVTQAYLTLCDRMDCSLPDSSVHGTFQARILQWVAISFFRDLSDIRIKPRSPALQADSSLSEPPGKPQAPFPIIINLSWTAEPNAQASRLSQWNDLFRLMFDNWVDQSIQDYLDGSEAWWHITITWGRKRKHWCQGPASEILTQ